VGDSDPQLTRVVHVKADNWFERLLRAIKEVGFPIVVCIFLFWDRATVMKDFQATINGLTSAIIELKNAVKKGHSE
jgi:hypothetical protein